MTKNDFIYALKTCGCLYHNEQIYYEENELIRMLEDLEMLEEEKNLKDMTELEHAIKHIKTRADAWAVKEVTEALQSISEKLDKALSQEPCDDAISREAVFDAIEREDKWLLAAKGHNGLTEIAFSGLKARVDALPSVTQKYTVFHCPKCGYQDAREL